jgi:hypothetical protein
VILARASAFLPPGTRSPARLRLPFLHNQYHHIESHQILPSGEEIKLQRNALSVIELGPEQSEVR